MIKDILQLLCIALCAFYAGCENSNVSYDAVIVVKTPSVQIKRPLVYNLTVMAQVEFRNFLQNAISCPPNRGLQEMTTGCPIKIPHNPYLHICCNNTSQFLKLHAPSFDLSFNQTLRV